MDNAALQFSKIILNCELTLSVLGTYLRPQVKYFVVLLGLVQRVFPGASDIGCEGVLNGEYVATHLLHTMFIDFPKSMQRRRTWGR